MFSYWLGKFLEVSIFPMDIFSPSLFSVVLGVSAKVLANYTIGAVK